MNPVDLRLYGIIDPEWTKGRDPVDLVRRAVSGGCTLIQYRDKVSDGRRLVESARALKDALKGTGVPLVVNDRVDVALAAEADGVHLGQDDMHPADARRLLGPDAIIGVTVKTTEHAEDLAHIPADYACIGSVFATGSKVLESQPIGVEGLARMAARVRLAARMPVGAIAGINRSNAAAVVRAGVDGVAVISALFMVDDPETEAQMLRMLVDGAIPIRGAAE